MAYSYLSPTYSFINFNNQHLNSDWLDTTCPGDDIGFCLPVQEEEDFAFQLIVQGDSETQGDYVCAMDMDLSEVGVYIGTPKATLNSVEYGLIPLKMTFAALGVEKYRLNDEQVLYYIPRLPGELSSVLQDGQCFQIVVKIFIQTGPGATVTLRPLSNCLKYEPNDCYSSVLTYGSDKDEAWFNYCISDTIINRVRLPLYATKPVYAEDQALYRQSSGRMRITKSMVTKLYEVQTDYMPEWAHDNLQALLVHDYKAIESGKYTGEFQKSDKYDLAHQDFINYPLAPASFKIEAMPLVIKNNNCAECSELPELITGDDTFVHTSYAGGTSYVFSLADLGITACCGPVTGTFLQLLPPPYKYTAISFVDEELHITYTADPGTTAQLHIIFLILQCPNGSEFTLQIRGSWNGVPPF